MSLVAFLALNTTANAGPKVFTVSFDGTCDTITMTYNKAQVLYATLHQAGCAGASLHAPSSNPIPGVGIVVKRNPGSSNARDMAVTETTPGDGGGTPAIAFMYKLDYPLTTGGAWAAYFTSDGKVLTKGAFGTYTVQ
jgi:hypothetical protein